MSSYQKEERGTGERKGGKEREKREEKYRTNWLKWKSAIAEKSPFCSHWVDWITQESKIGTKSWGNF